MLVNHEVSGPQETAPPHLFHVQRVPDNQSFNKKILVNKNINLKVQSGQIGSACSDYGWHRILSSHWLAHLYLMKKSTKVLLYFGLDCEMLEIFTDEP